MTRTYHFNRPRLALPSGADRAQQNRPLWARIGRQWERRPLSEACSRPGLNGAPRGVPSNQLWCLAVEW